MISFFISLGFYLVIGLIFWRLKILKKQYLEPVFMWVMMAGIFMLCQPFYILLYTYGYAVLLTGTAGYIFSIHLK
ncbi:MAG: hypothetical protein KJ770_00650 [Actinobacteria bacterium]|nr:hypothetical protein [Actinomycetota bacterium]